MLTCPAHTASPKRVGFTSTAAWSLVAGPWEGTCVFQVAYLCERALLWDAGPPYRPGRCKLLEHEEGWGLTLPLTAAKWKMRNEQGKHSGPVVQFQKLTFQFKTNNKALCLAWMSTTAKGRRYLLFLRQWKSSFIFCWRAHTVWGQPGSLGYIAQAWLGGRLELPSAFTTAKNYKRTHTQTQKHSCLHEVDGFQAWPRTT